MAQASLSGILSRLNSADEYHPFSADTFNDWSLEAGDVVQLKSGDRTYSSPVYRNKLSWKGKASSQIETTGNQTRESISKTSAKKYSSSRSSVNNGQSIYNEVWDEYGHLHSVISQTSSRIYAFVEDRYDQLKSGIDITASGLYLYSDSHYNMLRSGIELTSSTLTLYVDNKYSEMRSGIELTSSALTLYVDNNYDQLRSGIELTSSTLTLYVDNNYAQLKSGIELTSSTLSLYVDNKYAQLRSGIELTSSTLSLYVDNRYAELRSGIEMTSSSLKLYVENQYEQLRSGLHMTSSSITTYVQDKYNQMASAVHQTASSWNASVSGVVDSNGNISAASIALAINQSGSNAYIKADHIKIQGDTLMSGVLEIDSNGYLKATTGLTSEGPVNIHASLQTEDIAITTGHKIRYIGSANGEYYDFDLTKIKGLIASASVADNVLTLTPVYGDAINFSKATTLSPGTWGNGTTGGANRVAGSLVVSATQTNYNTTTQQNQDTVVATQNIYLLDSGEKVNSDGSAYVDGTNTWYVPVKAKYLSSTTPANAVYTGLRVYVDATAIRIAGKNDVTLTSTSWGTAPSSSISGYSNSFSVSTSGRPTELTESKTLMLVASGWTASSGLKTVYLVHTSNTASNRLAKLDVYATVDTITAYSSALSAPTTSAENTRSSGTLIATANSGHTKTSAALTLNTESVSDGKHYVKMSIGGTVIARIKTHRVQSKSVSGAYAGQTINPDNGYDAMTSVTVGALSAPSGPSDISWGDNEAGVSSSWSPTARTLNYSANGTTKYVWIGINPAGWLSGSNKVYMIRNSSSQGTSDWNGQKMAVVTVGMPPVTGYSWVDEGNYNFRCDISAGGGTISTNSHSFEYILDHVLLNEIGWTNQNGAIQYSNYQSVSSSWNPTARYIYMRATNGATQGVQVCLGHGSFVQGSMAIWIKKDNWEGDIMCREYVSIPSPANVLKGSSAVGTNVGTVARSSGSYYINFTVGGKEFYIAVV